MLRLRRRRPLLYNAIGDSTFRCSSHGLRLLCHRTGLYMNKNLSLAVIGKPIKPSSESKILEPCLWHLHSLAHAQASAGAIIMGHCSCSVQRALRGAHPFSKILLSKCRCQCSMSCSHSAPTYTIVQSWLQFPGLNLGDCQEQHLHCILSAFQQNLALAAALLGLLHCRLHSLQWVLCPCMYCSVWMLCTLA